MKKSKLIAFIILVQFLLTGIFIPVTYANSSVNYDMFAGLYDPKYEGARELPPVNTIPSDINPNSVKYLFDTRVSIIADLIDNIKKVGGQLDTMQAIIVDGEWKGVQYWVESVKSDTIGILQYNVQIL